MAATLDARLRLNSSEFSGGLSRAVRESHTAMQRIGQQFGTLRNVLTGGMFGAAAAGMLKDIIATGLEAEKLEAAMAATAGNAKLGARNFRDIKKLSGEIGLDAKESAKAMIQFQSAGMSASKAMESIRLSYNAVLATGGGTAEFGRVAYVLQQFRAASKITQQDINQLKNSLPTAARLMQEAFGSDRAEDINKLNISGREFVETLMGVLKALPQIGDTTERQMGRLKNDFEEMKGFAFTYILPTLKGVMAATKASIDGVASVFDKVQDMKARHMGINPDEMRARAAKREGIERAHEDAVADLEDERRERERAMAQAAENQKNIQRIIEKHEKVLAKAKEEARAFNNELRFEAGMQTYLDQEAANAIKNNLKFIQDANTEAAKLRREQMDLARGALDAANMAGRDELMRMQGDAWQDAVDAQGMTREERRAGNKAKRQRIINENRALAEEVKKRLKKEENDARANAFDNIKKGQFWDREEAKRRLRGEVKNEMTNALQKNGATLIEIRDALNHLAKA